MKVGFIGAGNMGSALARAVYTVQQAEILIFDKNEEKTVQLADELSASICMSAEELITECDAVFLGVKPNIVESVIEEIRETLKAKSNTLLISMAAGVSLQRFESLIGFEHPIIRIMPNTPVAVGCGVIAYTTSASIREQHTKLFLEILKNAGTLDLIDEGLLDAETAVAGCGPAFAYMFIDALSKAGVECGLSEEKALLYAAETVKGAAEMVLSGVDTPRELTRKVCSPGGSTIEGVKVLEDNDLYGTVGSAVKASFEKTKKLG